MRWILELLDRHIPVVSLCIALVLSAALMSLGHAGQAKVRVAVQMALWPSQRAVSLIEGYSSLWLENRRLRRSLTESNLNLDRLQSLSAENRRLRDLLHFAERSNLDLIPAQVVRRDAGPLTGVVLVDKGSADGIRERMTVTSTKGLVGAVAAVGKSNSEVRLLTSKDFAVSARLSDKEVHGIVKWDPAGLRLRMHNVPVQSEVALGDVVLSSSLGGNFVDGVRIGRVKQVSDHEDGLFKEIVLETPTYLWSLREVFVVPEVLPSPLDTILVRPSDGLP